MIRKARFRGSWYPYSANDNERITGPLDSSGDICMAVLPHAGLVYSGEIIKAFFEKIPLNTEKAVIISPSHYFHLPPGRIITADFTSAETPFGNVEARRLQAEGTMIANDVIAAEHGHADTVKWLLWLGADVKARDDRDSKRSASPLKPAPDAIIIDTSYLNIQEVIEKVCKIIDSQVKKS